MSQASSKTLCDTVPGGVALDDDGGLSPALLAHEDQNESDILFFRVVDKRLSSTLTFMGDTSFMDNVDFIAHSFFNNRLNRSPEDALPLSAVLTPRQDVLFVPRLAVQKFMRSQVRWLCNREIHEALSSLTVWTYKPVQAHSFSICGLKLQLALKYIFLRRQSGSA